MPDIPYTPPQIDETAFNCPHCNAYSDMVWGQAQHYSPRTGHTDLLDLRVCICKRCDNFSVWYSEEMIFPKKIIVESPNNDLPDNVKKDYSEAASILQDSPRGAAALLRLAIQKLCDSLIAGNDHLNTKIGKLVEDGLDKKIQQSLDVVRVVGNDAVHPGQIDLDDTPEVANQLFKLVNIIAQRMITEPKEVEEIYSSLPQAKLEGIESRDNKKAKDSS